MSGDSAARDANADAGADPGAGAAQWTLDVPPALQTVCESFGLTSFERDLLLLCAGVELDASIARLCAAARGVSVQTPLTLSFAMAVLADAHWSALTPSSALRRWYLVELSAPDGLMHSALRISERVLHFLAGIDQFDARLQAVAERQRAPDVLPAPHVRVAERLASLWSEHDDAQPPPIVQLCDAQATPSCHIVAAACRSLGVAVLKLRAADIPHAPAERGTLARISERDCVLSGSALIVECLDAQQNSAEEDAALAFASQVSTRIVLLAATPVSGMSRPVLRFDLDRATARERREFWHDALGEEVATRLNGGVERLAAHFDLDAPSIRAIVDAGDASIGAEVSGNARVEAGREALWEGCRRQARASLAGLADRIEPVARWDDLVLPVGATELLREIAVHVRSHGRVFDDWGFSGKSSRGTGVCALFAGPSGTGKTMAAEVLANDLDLDLFRVDLSRVVSKYIGETEKNLARIFDAGEASGAILLFDEADALFGKRSDVKDSHDRYANIEVSYLLQRMECYRNGVAILTTNMKSALDQAFWRRLRFIVSFQFPDAALRAEIWRRVFPAGAPVADLDIRKLSRLNVAGGSIHNIAVNAAFRAADEGCAIGMQQLRWAARQEYAKANRLPSDAETGDWQ